MTVAPTTPRPWRINGREIIGAEGTGYARVIAILAHGYVSPAPPFDYLDTEHRKDRDVVEANAELIVRAVNSHQDMLDALTDALPWLDRARRTAPEVLQEQLYFVAEQARAAIAQAEGER
jgi:hypothetical protein